MLEFFEILSVVLEDLLIIFVDNYWREGHNAVMPGDQFIEGYQTVLSNGQKAVFSVENAITILHEIGHATCNIEDEYYPIGRMLKQEAPNMDASLASTKPVCSRFDNFNIDRPNCCDIEEGSQPRIMLNKYFKKSTRRSIMGALSSQDPRFNVIGCAACLSEIVEEKPSISYWIPYCQDTTIFNSDGAYYQIYTGIIDQGATGSGGC